MHVHIHRLPAQEADERLAAVLRELDGETARRGDGGDDRHTGGERFFETDYLKPWVEVAAPARALLPSNFDSLGDNEKRRASEFAVIQNSVMNLSGYPWVRERMDAGNLKLHGWHFDMHDGKLTRLDHESGEWVAVT